MIDDWSFGGLPAHFAALGSAVRFRLESIVSGVRFGQFVSVGVAGALVDTATLVAFVEGLSLSPTVAKVGSWEVAVIFIFAVNERWTFENWGRAGPMALARRFLTSNLIRIGGFALTLAVLSVLVGLGVWYVLANAVGIGVGFVLNYALENVLTWKVGTEP